MLKRNKSADPNGMVSELLKDGGEDLKDGILNMFNEIKRKQIVPDFMYTSDICSIWKSKGSRMDIGNERGISLINVFKKALENLLYNDLYENIDANMSESNIGARRKRRINDHLLIMRGVIQAQLS